MTDAVSRESVKVLEGLLVKEFRSTQALLRLARDEQAALARADVPRLVCLAELKEGLLDTISGLEAARRAQAVVLAGRPAETTSATAADIPAAGPSVLNPESASRIANLFEGIQTLSSQIRELARANRALAAVALRQAANLQAGLMNTAQTDLPALCAAILDARSALDAHDAAGMHAAAGALEEALQPPAPQPDGLVERMAYLYRQEKAYQAVLRGSSRMIAGA